MLKLIFSQERSLCQGELASFEKFQLTKEEMVCNLLSL